MQIRVSRRLYSNLYRKLFYLPEASISNNPSIRALLPHLSLQSLPKAHFSTIPNRPMRGDRRRDDPSEDHFLRNLNFGDDGEEESTDKTQQNISTQMPSRPLKGEERSDPFRGERRPDGSKDLFSELNDKHEKMSKTRQIPPTGVPNRPIRGQVREGDGILRQKATGSGEGFGEDIEKTRQNSQARLLNRSMRGEERNDSSFKIGGNQSEDSVSSEKRGDQSGDSIIQKLKFGDIGSGGKVENTHQSSSPQIHEGDSAEIPESSLQDADEIFKKMKETGLIPNAVAMLDGLCKDGLVQEAMKLFGLMREKGTIPEVIIYTAVVEGFCKAAKFDDAMRIFRKMQKNGVLPNAVSYRILIQRLCKGRKLEDAVEFCKEMVDAGHSPNAGTFTCLVDGFCKEKGVEEAESFIRGLRERGFAVDEKVVREHLDKKGPFSPLVWEAIFGKKSSQRPF